MNCVPTSDEMALQIAVLARELDDGYSHFDITHTECDERYADLKRMMRALLDGLREPAGRRARVTIELAQAEHAFQAAGGRGVELAERIDALREELRAGTS